MGKTEESSMIGLWIMMGAFLGAISRYAVSQLVDSLFPYATFFVNVLGSFLLGLFVGMNIEGEVALFVTTGFLGSFTTFSTFKVDFLKLWERREKKEALFYLTGTYLIGIIAAFLGIVAGRTFV